MAGVAHVRCHRFAIRDVAHVVIAGPADERVKTATADELVIASPAINCVITGVIRYFILTRPAFDGATFGADLVAIKRVTVGCGYNVTLLVPRTTPFETVRKEFSALKSTWSRPCPVQ